jgi:FkbM family methyltransferase
MEYITIQNNYLKIKKPLIWVDKESDFMKNNWPNTITYDRNIKKDILEYAVKMEKDKCIIDAGGHIGDGAIVFAHTLKEIGRTDIFVYAIEPDKYKCDFIEDLKDKNDLQNLIVINTGLSDKIGSYKKKPSKSMNTGKTTFIEGADEISSFNFTTLDNLKKEGKINHSVGIIHFDLEGMEQKAFDGSKSILETDKPYISAENHNRPDLYKLPEGYEYIKVLNKNQIYVNNP